ncbi:molybdopterin molybdotransferase MoeA [Ureibacillus sinduriensis]|uniref:Molybdopterin molybdenumtransferase n=1 Tax=Ureibacillus sinduriensis BLB-1 = JCM 15800 TaxID=1384057 RepID=A0A0A3IUU8_9BACL|nr:gephyrin-like molybdotransferase Glp [Ureibacillus sinduriensis]KGR78607.1 molybdopterin molybdenumtransferase [Ureibacillus sinduriensis BLB-1 = JCM 15800]
MLTDRRAILIGEAIEKIMKEVGTGRVEKIPLIKAGGRYLAEDIIANQDVPAFDRSLYDGYAIMAEDTRFATKESPIELEVVGHIGAGSVFLGEIKQYQAIRIMTGAEMPKGCNAMIMLEQVTELEKEDKQFIVIDKQIQINEKVLKKGAEITKGTLLVEKGAQITPGIVGLLATFGYSEVMVGVKPTVGVLATGSELLEIDEPLEPGKIRNSNSYMLMAQIEKVGANALYLGKLEDRLDESYAAMKKALTQVDIVITTGGVSVGDFDFLPDIYERLGAKVLFNKIAMRPGSVTTVAKLGKQFLFGLSGNPSASFIGFELLVRPVLKTILGNEQPYLVFRQAILAEDFIVPNAFTQLIRTKQKVEGTNVYVSSNGLNMSSSITSLVGTDALIVLPPCDDGYKKGSIVDILLLSDEGQKINYFTTCN